MLELGSHFFTTWQHKIVLIDKSLLIYNWFYCYLLLSERQPPHQIRVSVADLCFLRFYLFF